MSRFGDKMMSVQDGSEAKTEMSLGRNSGRSVTILPVDPSQLAGQSKCTGSWGDSTAWVRLKTGDHLSTAAKTGV